MIMIIITTKLNSNEEEYNVNTNKQNRGKKRKGRTENNLKREQIQQFEQKIKVDEKGAKIEYSKDRCCIGCTAITD